MKDNKKKTLVVVALALVIVCVGVFQFMSSGSSAPAPAEKKKPKATEVVADDGPKNPMFASALPARDPFAAPAQTAPTNQPANQPKPQAPANNPEPRAPVLPPMQIDKSAGLGTAPVTIQSLPEAKFSFTVSGVMLGEKPMAVFTDGQGNQRLVMLGGSLDPDSTVVSIDKDSVTVRFHGKNLRLTVEGNPNAK